MTSSKKMRKSAIYTLVVLVISLFLKCNDVYAENVLIIGNSLTLHRPKPDIGWNGDWGMAASSSENDYVHKLASILEKRNHTKVNVSIISAGVIEGNFFQSTVYNLSNNYHGRYDYIIIQIGDNINFTNPLKDTFYERYNSLLRTLNPKLSKKGILICLGKWWQSDWVDREIKSTCEENGGKFVALKPISQNLKSNASSERSFTNPGVGSHPGDWAMQKIAESINQAINAE